MEKSKETMPSFWDFDPTKMKKLLIITSSGGGGLLQAANAKEQEARAKNPQISIVRKDLLKDWMGERFGNFCTRRWNEAQIQGDVEALRFLIASQQFFDYFSWPHLFLCTLYTLFKEKVDHVIDTQPIGTSAILKALRIYNAIKKKRVYLQKVLVDLPTKAATHFFKPIKRLTKKDRPYLKLTTIAPLLEEGQTVDAFWQTMCRLTKHEIHYEDLNVRKSFRKFQNVSRSEKETSLLFRFKGEEEFSLMQKCWKRGKLTGKRVGERELIFSLSPDVKLISIVLGSQPANEATWNYVKEWIQMAKEPNFCKTPCALFVFCAEHIPGQKTLLYKVADYIENLKEYPENFSVVPFSFQDDDVIASLFHRSDITCTRSGGQTAMELMAVSTGEIWIHSESKKQGAQYLSLDELLEGIPGWEAANALYLQKLRGAKVVTPEIFVPSARKILQCGAEKETLSCEIA
ncbi:MAG TPA: hypothetical protein VJK48_07125 [Chlamydiales bacterium]|nr:MAG: hypothetical protein A3F67_08265 [Verrucomicrobia bacterium RIFCSPHIGHO2_12_FULL_41_10]HLB53461.1 hypothetical protein [Chlamydiales bacterium]